jgi:t-SNARE complex subunit (syntaxin)
VIEINHIMRDIGAIVSEQSPIIAAIEQNVSGANDNIVAANQQLHSASRYQVKCLTHHSIKLLLSL